MAVREARRLQRQSGTIAMYGAIGSHAADAIAEHAAIYEAIRDGDPAQDRAGRRGPVTHPMRTTPPSS